MDKHKIVTFGELLLRFSKLDHLRLTQGDMFTSKYGGSEANVAVSLATQGENVTYITRLPDTPVGHAGAMNLAQLGVDTSQVLYGGQRIGTYYFEPAAGMAKDTQRLFIFPCFRYHSSNFTTGCRCHLRGT